MTMTIAQEILRQLGGAGRLSVMIGARNFIGGEASVSFRWTAKSTNRANAIRIVLRPDDTYTVEFLRVPRGAVEAKTISCVEDVYASSLRRTIESATGLYLSL